MTVKSNSKLLDTWYKNALLGSSKSSGAVGQEEQSMMYIIQNSTFPWLVQMHCSQDYSQARRLGTT